MISILNYGLGNIGAVSNIYQRLKIPFRLIETADQLDGSERIILPGVGAFDSAMTRLNQSGMRPKLEKMVKEQKVPILGICVGMQMMAESSDEGKLAGLGWIPGTVQRFNVENQSKDVDLPHMGWNDVKPRSCDCIFAGLEKNARFYFLHSYYYCPLMSEHILAETGYTKQYASSVRFENIYGVQFHPEKSHHCGVRLLKNFSEI